MAPSLRDLMKSEKESRKRSLQLTKEKEPAAKVPRVSEESIPTTSSVDDATNGPPKSQSQPKVHFGPTHSTGQFTPDGMSKDHHSADDLEDVKVIEETYELLEDEPIVSPRKETPKSDTRDEYKSDDKLVYEQLNTAFCSNLDFERDAILQDFGVEQDEYIDSEEDDVENAKLKSTITSANFGTSNIAVSTSENLPVGFFDDQNVDAKARGKLTTKEATEKMRQLSRKKALYLKEAKYIQEKHMESHREQIRLENDLLDHQEALKDLKNRVENIRANISATLSDDDKPHDKPSDVMATMDHNDHDDHSMDIHYDDIHWRSRAIR